MSSGIVSRDILDNYIINNTSDYVQSIRCILNFVEFDFEGIEVISRERGGGEYLGLAALEMKKSRRFN